MDELIFNDHASIWLFNIVLNDENHKWNDAMFNEDNVFEKIHIYVKRDKNELFLHDGSWMNMLEILFMCKLIFFIIL